MGIQKEARHTGFVDIHIYNTPHILLILILLSILGLTHPQNLEEECRTAAQNAGSKLVKVTWLGLSVDLKLDSPTLVKLLNPLAPQFLIFNQEFFQGPSFLGLLYYHKDKSLHRAIEGPALWQHEPSLLYLHLPD